MAIALYAAFVALERRVVVVGAEGRRMRRLAIARGARRARRAAARRPSRPASGPARQEPFTVMLDYFPNADHAGLYAAQAAGLYEKAGLDVKLQAPPDPSAPLKLLRGRPRRRRDLLRARAAARARQRRREPHRRRRAGADAADVADLAARRAASGRPPTSPASASAPPGIPYQSAYLKSILTEAGVDPGSVKETNVGFNLTPAMLSEARRRDARLVLELRGRRPRSGATASR